MVDEASDFSPEEYFVSLIPAVLLYFLVQFLQDLLHELRAHQRLLDLILSPALRAICHCHQNLNPEALGLLTLGSGLFVVVSFLQKTTMRGLGALPLIVDF